MISARAEWAPDFSIYDMDSVDDVLAADPDDYADDVEHYVWAWIDEAEGTHPVADVRQRSGHSGGRGDRRRRGPHHRLPQPRPAITQGKGSELRTAWSADGWVKVAGRVVDDGVRRLD